MDIKYIIVSIANANSHSRKTIRTWAPVAVIALMLTAMTLFPGSSQLGQADNRPLSERRPAAIRSSEDNLTDIKKRPVEILRLPEDSESGTAPVAVILFDVPEADTGFKAYMDFRSIKNQTTAQYRLQQEAWTDEQGFRRLGDRYMIALGTFYSKQCGRVFRITLGPGANFEAVVADIKADADTDTLHQRHGSVIHVVGATHDQVMEAIRNEAFKDFEDCLQDACAQQIGADCLVTCNTKDFAQAKTKVYAPDELIEALEAENN